MVAWVDTGYSNEEREAYKEIVFSNTIQSMRVILEAMEHMNIDVGSPDNAKHKVDMSLFG